MWFLFSIELYRRWKAEKTSIIIMFLIPKKSKHSKDAMNNAVNTSTFILHTYDDMVSVKTKATAMFLYESFSTASASAGCHQTDIYSSVGLQLSPTISVGIYRHCVTVTMKASVFCSIGGTGFRTVEWGCNRLASSPIEKGPGKEVRFRATFQ